MENSQDCKVGLLGRREDMCLGKELWGNGRHVKKEKEKKTIKTKQMNEQRVYTMWWYLCIYMEAHLCT